MYVVILQMTKSHPTKLSAHKTTHLTRLTCPRPCLFLPWLRLL